MKLCLAQEPEADELLSENPLALLVGMLLDQQVTIETAFAGPKKIADRMGGLGAEEIADYNPDKFAALCSERPAIHRFPGSMAKRIQTLAQIIVDRYDGDAAALWTAGEPHGAELLRRLKGLPGFGDHKAKIFPGVVGQAIRCNADGLAGRCRGVRRGRHALVGRRHSRRPFARRGAVLQEADQSRQGGGR